MNWESSSRNGYKTESAHRPNVSSSLWLNINMEMASNIQSLGQLLWLTSVTLGRSDNGKKWRLIRTSVFWWELTWIILSALVVKNLSQYAQYKFFRKYSSTLLVSTVFSHWRHRSDYLNRHENTTKHVHSIRAWCKIKRRLEKNCTIQKNVFNWEKKQ